MSEMRIGIIGLGKMGAGHAKYLIKHEVRGARLMAVCDSRPERLLWAKENLGDHVQLMDNLDAFFASGSLDGVLIATPHYSHTELAIRAFGLGLHVLCEKPAGVYTKQVRLMNEAAEASARYSV